MREVKVTMIVDSDGAVRGIRNADGSMARLDKTVEGASKEVTRFGRVMDFAMGQIAAQAALKLGNALGSLVRGGFRFLADSVRSAGIQQIAERRLARALLNTGDASEASRVKLANLAAELQKVSNFGDESIMTAQALLLSFREVGGAEGAALLSRSVVDVAAGLSRVTGEAVDLNTVAQAVGRALTGGVGALTRYGISLSEAQKEQFATARGMERVQLLAEVLDGNFKGLAAATVNPFTQMKNAVGDLQEEIGRGLRVELEGLARDVTAFLQDPSVIESARTIGRIIISVIQAVLQVNLRGRAEIQDFFAVFDRLAAGFQRTWANVLDAVGMDQRAEEFRRLALENQVQAELAERAAERYREQAKAIGQVKEQAEEAAKAIRLGGGDGDSLTDEQRAQIQKIEDFRRQLQIEAMEDGLPKRLEQIRFEIEREIETARAEYGAKYPELFREIEALLIEQRERLSRELLSVPIEVFPEPKDIIPDDDLADIDRSVRVLDGSLQAISEQIGVLETAWLSATDEESRAGILEQIRLLEAAERRIRALRDATIDWRDVGEQAATAVIRAFGAAAESIGAAIAGVKDETNALSRVLTLALADLARQIGDIFLAQSAAYFIAGQFGKAAKMAAAGALLHALAGGLSASANRAGNASGGARPEDAARSGERSDAQARIQLQGRRTGGPVLPYQRYVVGEGGVPEILQMGPTPGHVFTPAQARAALASGVRNGVLEGTLNANIEIDGRMDLYSLRTKLRRLETKIEGVLGE